MQISQISREEILQKLKEILISAGDGDIETFESCTESTKLITELGLSSVSMLFMVIAIEEEFGIRFDDVGVSDFVTLGDVMNFIEKSLK